MSGALSNRFGGSSLSGLAAKLPSKVGIAQAPRIALDLIDEDPNQPRKYFDPKKLEQLAASIRMEGILQPIGVLPSAGGRYLLRWGARRCRAAKIAGRVDIEAVLVNAEQAGLASQVIENAHRVSNSDSELATAVEALTAQGMKNADIATVLAVDDPQSLKYYRTLAQAREIPELAAWIDNGLTLRAIYELHAAWRRGGTEQRERMQNALFGLEELTVTTARRIIAVMEAPAWEPQAQEATIQPEEERASTTAQPAAQPPKPGKSSRRKPIDEPSDPDAERVAKVHAWINDPTRPRPTLTV